MPPSQSDASSWSKTRFFFLVYISVFVLERVFFRSYAIIDFLVDWPPFCDRALAQLLSMMIDNLGGGGGGGGDQNPTPDMDKTYQLVRK